MGQTREGRRSSGKRKDFLRDLKRRKPQRWGVVSGDRGGRAAKAVKGTEFRKGVRTFFLT